MPHRSGQIHRADEDAVQSIHSEELVDLAHGLRCLDGDHHHDLIVGMGQIVLPVHAKAAGAGGRGDAANAQWRILAGFYGVSRLFGAVDVGDQQALYADVQQPLDGDEIVPRSAGERHHRVGVHGLQLMKQRHKVARAMLHVHHQPVESGLGHHFGGDAVRPLQPCANGRFPLQQALLDGICEYFVAFEHTVFLQPFLHHSLARRSPANSRAFCHASVKESRNSSTGPKPSYSGGVMPSSI